MPISKVRNPPVLKTIKFTIDASIPIEDKLFNAQHLSEYIRTHVKVNKMSAKPNQVAARPADSKVVVLSQVAVSKRYFKYLVKRFLKLHNLQNFMRVLATDKSTYKLKYINVQSSPKP